MKLLFKQRLFSWFGRFDVFAEDGATVFTVEGKLALGKKLVVYAPDGQELAVLRQELLRFMPTYVISIRGQEIGRVKGKLSFLRRRFDLDYRGWAVEGDVWDWNYSVLDAAGRKVMHIEKKIWNLTDTYEIEVEHPEDSLDSLLIALAIDASKETDSN